MPEPTTIILTLKAVAPILLKVVPWARKNLPRNSPVAKAIRVTADQYSSRLPGIDVALETWVLSDAFQSHVESVESGPPVDPDVAHVELFLKTTGHGLGVASLETVAEALTLFYSELYLQLCEGDHGLRVIGGKLDAVHRELIDQRQTRQAVDVGPLPYRPPIVADATSRASTEEDRKAEVELDLIKTLVNRRQARTALRLLAAIQRRVDRGDVSPAVRFRFFVNKGVCLMLDGEWDQAEEEFKRAQTLEPGNWKALINLAQVASFRDHHELALEYLASVLGQDPNHAAANALRLACLHELGRDSEVQEILNAQPSLANDTHCLYTLAYIAFDQQKFDEAERYLRRHNEQDDQHPEAWELLGRVIVIPAQRELRQTAASPNWIPSSLKVRIEEAEACFSRAEQLLATSETHREMKSTLTNRGVARTLLGRHHDARQDFEQALRIDPSMDEVRRNLASLYLNTGRPDDAVRLFEQIESPSLKLAVAPLLAASYLDLKKPGAARQVLEPLVDSVQADDRLIVKDILLVACQRLKDQVACDRILASLASYTSNPEARRITAEYYAREDEFDQAVASAQLAVEEAGAQRSARYRLFLADILYRAGRFAEAADEYTLVPIPMDESPESRRHLIALFNAGRLGKALQVAQAVRNGRPAIAEVSEIEALIYERAGDLDTANRLRSELLTAGVCPARQKLKIALNHFRRGRKEEASSLTLEVDLPSILEDSGSLRDAAMLRTLLGLPDALAFAYQLLQQEPNDANVHLFYVNTFFRREGIDCQLLQPETVANDCVVTLRLGGQRQTFTIIDGESDTTKNWLSTEHPLAKQMLAKRAGERFRFPEGELSEAEYEIQGIQSKYVGAFQDCMGRFNERFPAHYGLTRVEAEKDDLTKIVLMLERQRAGAELILDFYRSRQVPACAAARLFGKSDVETFRALVEDPRIKVVSYHGTLDRMRQEESALSTAKTVLLETSALVTLQSLGILHQVSTAFDSLRVTQHAIDALAEAVMSLFPEKQTGYLFSDSPGHIQVVSRTSEEAIREQDFYRQLLDFVRTRCQVVAPGGRKGLEEFEKVEIQKMLGPVALSTLSTAADFGILVISDDLPLRVLAQNSYSVSSVGTLSLLRHLRRQSVLSEDECHKAVQWLVDRGFSFVSINKHDVLWVLRKNDWSPTLEGAAFLQALTGPDCDAKDALSVGLDVLHELWNEPLLPATQELTSDLLLRALVTGRDPGLVLQALQAMNSQRSAIWTPAMNRIQRVIRSWSPRNRRLM